MQNTLLSCSIYAICASEDGCQSGGNEENKHPARKYPAHHYIDLRLFVLVSNSQGAEELPAWGAASNREPCVLKGQLAWREDCHPPMLTSKGRVSSEGYQSESLMELQDEKLPKD